MPAPRFALPVLASLVLALTAPPVRAQFVPSLDAGTASITYAGDQREGSLLVTVTPAVRRVDAHSRLTATGTLGAREPGLGGTASRGTVAGALLAPAFGALRLEGGMSAGWDAFHSGMTTGWWRGEAQARLELGRRGVWLAATTGRALNGEAWHPVTSASTGVWTRLGGATLSASLTNARATGAGEPTQRVRTIQTIDSTFDPFGDTLYYQKMTRVDTSYVRGNAISTDAAATLQWQRGPLALELSVGRRLSSTLDERMWGGARATLWLSNRMALVTTGGTRPSSLTDGRPATRYMTFGFHYAPRSREQPAAPSRAPDRRAPAPAVEVRDAGRGERSLRIHVPGARTVEVMGDFTDWTPVALRPDGTGTWATRLRIAPGAHRINMRVDGGAWRVPPGLARVEDDFSGAAGLLIVR